MAINILSGLFMTVVMIFILFIAVEMKRHNAKRDEYYRQQLSEVRKGMDDLRMTFRNEVTDVLKQIKDIIH